MQPDLRAQMEAHMGRVATGTSTKASLLTSCLDLMRSIFVSLQSNMQVIGDVVALNFPAAGNFYCFYFFVYLFI